MKVKIVKEVKRSDGLWRFACGDVLTFLHSVFFQMNPLGATPTPWTGSSRRGSISPTLRGPYWWTGGTRWEGWEWIGWDTWGGGATRCPEWRSPLPNAILQASRGEKGGESQVGGAWGRLEDGGFLTFLLVCFRTNQSEEIICKKVKVIFIKSSSFYSLVSCGLAVSTMYHSSAELDERRYLGESESFVPNFEFCWLFFDLLSVLETGLRPKVLATNNKFTNVVVPFLAVTDKQTNIMLVSFNLFGLHLFRCASISSTYPCLSVRP